MWYILVISLALLQFRNVNAQHYELNGFNFHIDDMFDDRLMPMQILSQHELTKWFTNGTTATTSSSSSAPDAWLLATPGGGTLHGFDFNAALDSMDYHRRMMNEFMASDYITQQILHETLMEVNGKMPLLPAKPPQPLPADGFPSGSVAGIHKRMGAVKSDSVDVDAITSRHAMNSTYNNKNNTSSSSSNNNNNANSNHKLLNDEGMTRYKTWLRRYALLNKTPASSSSSTTSSSHAHKSTTTLKDIQKQLLAQTARSAAGGVHNRRHQQPQSKHAHEKMDLPPNYTDDDDVETEEEHDFEEGDITGYALTTDPYDYSNVRQYEQTSLGPHNWPLTGAAMSASVPNISPLAKAMHNKNGYDSSYDDYSGGSGAYHAPPPQHAPPHPPPLEALHTAPAASSGTKEIGLKDITDIALTTLAFLSFGMFILQVLMCITMGKDDSNNMMMMPMEATESNEMMNDGVEEIRRRRRRRSTIDENNQRLIMMNDLARRVLFSLDAALHMPKDNGVCNFWSLCENNRFARQQNNGQKYWIPIWSLGLSWFTSRVRNDNEQLTAQSEYLTIMQSLKAIVIGLATDNCETFYANACRGIQLH